MSFSVEKRGEFPTFFYSLIWHGGYVLNGWTWNGWESRAEKWTGLFDLCKHFLLWTQRVDKRLWFLMFASKIFKVQSFVSFVIFSETGNNAGTKHELPSAKLTWQWKIPILFIGNTSSKGPFFIVMLVYGRGSWVLVLINSLSLISTWQGTEWRYMIRSITVQDFCFLKRREKECMLWEFSIVFEVYSCCWLDWYRIKQYI